MCESEFNYLLFGYFSPKLLTKTISLKVITIFYFPDNHNQTLNTIKKILQRLRANFKDYKSKETHSSVVNIKTYLTSVVKVLTININAITIIMSK